MPKYELKHKITMLLKLVDWGGNLRRQVVLAISLVLIVEVFSFGTTHFCAGCHDDFQRLVNLPRALLPRCPAGPKAVQLEGDGCPLRVQHPATGEEFALGCGICRNISTF